ncbi:MAG TPA: tRNA (adenosine(37)-N6)-threonylcarbamoyltransferase complex dimerization subunit type 1 TsaB [Gemmatimonadaceae bacterium]
MSERSLSGDKNSPPAVYTLALEGATYAGSVALLRDAAVIAERTLADEDGSVSRAGRGEKLMPAIAECLAGAKVERSEIARIVCGSGPGSFTSLRVAGSVAKGLATGLGVPLYAVSSLLLTVTGAKPPAPQGEYLSVLDAMRGEFYAARVVLTPDEDPQLDPARIISAEELREIESMNSHLRVIGPGQQIDAHPHARGVAPLLAAVIRAGTVDLASWEPDYGRLAEAQVRWEAAHGRPLAT